jgi:hypothetical protein
MKKIALLLLVAACLGAGGVDAAEPAAPAATDAGAVPAAKGAERCAPATGSRIARKVKPGESCEVHHNNLRSYSRDDLERTGRIDLDEALETLDPAFSRRL